MVTTPAPPAPRRNSSSRLLTPLAPVFYIVNWMALVGWSYVLYRVLSYYYSLLHHHQNSHHHVVDERATTATVHQLLLLLLQETKSILVLLEGICVVEVGRIFLKDLPGNLTLGVILHTIRITALVEVLPRVVSGLAPNSNDAAAAAAAAATRTDEWTASGWSCWTAPVVLLSWAVTEVGRYPMYLFPSSRTCRALRLLLPLITFPVGAFAEFCAAYQVFFGKSSSNDDLPLWLKFLLVDMMLVNGVLGPYLAYPHLLKKGLPVLGLSSFAEGASTSSRASSSVTSSKKKPN